MWLINVQSRELECFNDERHLPDYAILSHTWTGSEMSMQEFRKSFRDSRDWNYDSERAQGSAKIEETCVQARAHGLRYVWVDTCCIDKTSSAELSEAINSMFRWYQRANICYVYLEDVDWRPGVVDPEDMKGEFARARWFTRGWTLQELIAPRDMVFYDQKWTEVGTKASLVTAISLITGIDLAVVAGIRSLGDICVAERMTWAAHRETSKVEDMAYSLFGIFDVNMPLLYGEGAKAFVRLQEEILKEQDDMSIFAWQNPHGDLSCYPEAMSIWRRVPPWCLDVAPTSSGGESLFARHPDRFCKVPTTSTRSSTLAGEHSMVGGKGLKIELPLFTIAHAPEGPLRVAVIEGADGVEDGACTVGNMHGQYLAGVVLQRLCNGHYMRHAQAPLVRVPADKVDASDMRTIYVRKNISPYEPRPAPSARDSTIRTVDVQWYDPLLELLPI